MVLKTRRAGGVTVIDLDGKLFIGDDLAEFRKAIDSALKDSQVNILLNLENLRMMDSSGLGEIVRSYTSAKKAGGVVKIVNLTSKIKELLFITKLITVFDTFEDEETAISSF